MKKNILFMVAMLSVSCNFLRASSSDPKTWQNCEKIVSRNCGEQVHSYVFDGNNSYVSYDCCVQVVEIGKKCHDLFTNVGIESPLYKSKKTYFLKRSEDLWNECVAEFKGKSPPQKCPRMRDGKCEHSIVSSIFHGVGEVNANCCGYLVWREKECHDSFVQSRIAHGGFEHNKTEILETSDEVWNKCASVAQNLPVVKTCKRKVTSKCGRQIARNVLFNEGSIEKQCCVQLLKAGRVCHDILALTDVALPELQAHASDILKRTANTWIKCREQFKWGKQ